MQLVLNEFVITFWQPLYIMVSIEPESVTQHCGLLVDLRRHYHGREGASDSSANASMGEKERLIFSANLLTGLSVYYTGYPVYYYYTGYCTGIPVKYHRSF